MRKLFGRLHDWWFAPSSQYQLGIFRILLVAWHLWFFDQRLFPRLESVAARSTDFFEAPSFARWLALPVPIADSELTLCVWLALGSALMACLGLVTRVSLIVLAAVNMLLGLSANGWGYSAHASALPALVLVLLAFAPGATSYSLDRVLASWFARYRSRAASKPARQADVAPAHSVWPLRAMLVTMSLYYFSAGYSKLAYSGVEWADGQTLSFYLGGGSVRGSGQTQRFFSQRHIPESAKFRDHVGIVDYAYVGRPTPLGLWLSGQLGLVKALSWLSLLWELLFPLALLGPRLRSVCLLLGVGFHVGIELTLRINFTSYLICYAAFINWSVGAERVRFAIRRLTSRPAWLTRPWNRRTSARRRC